MLLVTRERLLVHLLALGGLTNLYQRRDPAYLPAVVDWLSQVEHTLQELRHPLAGVAGSERGLLLASADGWQDPEVVRGVRFNMHKVQRATAARILARVAEKVERTITEVDARLESVREKIAQLLAVASVAEPLPLARAGEQRDEWLQRLWENVSINHEIQSMYAYLTGALPHHDLMHLLGETVDRLLQKCSSSAPVEQKGQID